ncbi:transposase [Catenuloplanes nepalensis]|uniref:Transposase n=1 Tax=Catenuloplanes nepalensis TaxID=587533 RepID=A0ABT9MM34_9ACTN|nr:IS5 family transposase [Catenuloplanes nepalensis]MDP9792276.1 transposase [Catenuloplanes nepalensis]MDP9792487.1 transposase [Catenuloplanes nepalensis]MDP9796855.1 transposase [Catenuloplanes nepalensis]
MGDRKPYPSDVSDAQWALIGPFLDVWRAGRVSVAGRTGEQDLREVVNAILYQNRTGCQWAYLPHDLPQKPVVYYYFALWRDDGTDAVIHDLLRCQARQKAGRAEDPTMVVLDTQSVRAANHVPAATTGKDAGKKVPGRKRGLAVDALGLIIAVVVTAASVTDNVIGIRLLDKVAAHAPTVTLAMVDAGFKQDVAVHGAVTGIDVEVVKRSDTMPGFVPVKKRWIVEQVYGTLMLHRRLAREYESRPESSVSRTLWASIANMARRLTGTSTPTWRDR